jgi:outer membrane protein assembly factor BamB
LGDFGYNSKIWAVNPNGTEKWHYTINDRIYSDPAIGEDGTIYIGSNDNYLYALNPDGTLKWKFKTGKAVGGSASIADDGTVYAHGTWDYLYALYPNNGTVKWKYTILCNSNPSIDSDGIIYTGGNGKICAIYPNGTRKWTFDLGNERWTAGTCPAISADGTIYVSVCIGIQGWDGAEIIAINSNGTLRWRKKIANDYTHSSPSIAEDGTIYVGSAHTMSTGYLHAFGPQETNDPPTSPSITGPSEGKVDTEYEFTFKSTDPDRNPVSFYIEWGDGKTTGWTMDYNTGEVATYSHTWTEGGNFTIKAKARDTFGLEGDWATFEIGMKSKNKATNNMLLWRIVGRFPLLNRLFNLF